MNKLILSTFLLFSSFLFAQEVVSSSGDYFSNANGSVAFTVGEVVINTITSGSNNVTQGFHQNDLTVAGMGDFEDNLQVKIFPNPTTEILQLDINNFTGLSYRIFDITGRLLSGNLIEKRNTEVNVNTYSRGLYLLVLYNDKNQKLKTYRIIKN